MADGNCNPKKDKTHGVTVGSESGHTRFRTWDPRRVKARGRFSTGSH